MDCITYNRNTTNQNERRQFTIHKECDEDRLTIIEQLFWFYDGAWTEKDRTEIEVEPKNIIEVTMKGSFYDGHNHFYLYFMTTVDKYPITVPFDFSDTLLEAYTMITDIMERRGY